VTQKKRRVKFQVITDSGHIIEDISKHSDTKSTDGTV